jgi:hypothetical protein
LTEDRQPAHWQRQREILQRAASRGSLNAEDDIGDVTIIQNEDGTPQRTSPRDRKGKARESSDDYSESAQLYGQAVLEEDHNGDEEPRDAAEESQRIEAVGPVVSDSGDFTTLTSLPMFRITRRIFANGQRKRN